MVSLCAEHRAVSATAQADMRHVAGAELKTLRLARCVDHHQHTLPQFSVQAQCAAVKDDAVDAGKTFETVSSRTSGSGIIANLGRLRGVDPQDLAALGARVAEGVQKRALESKTVAGLQHVFCRIDNQFDFAR